jgi:SAM-dependent methyltransferase
MKKNDPLSESISILKSAINYNKWIFDNIKPYLGNNVLEIGCGTGNITDYMLQKNRKITGVEIDRSFACCSQEKYRRSRNVRILHGDFLKLKSIKKASYDSSVSLNVLEHIKDDAAAIRKIHSALKKGGVMVNLVPAMHFAYGTLDRELGHYRRYEKKDMAGLYEGNGFKLEKMFYMNFIGAFAWAMNSRVLGRKDFPSSQPVLFDRFFVPVIKPVEAAIHPPIGQSLIAVGRKI